ncbi:MAG: RDD family protein [Thermoanaerobaculia bacterium]|nr:RDD family protein [Thermoanaerobaculia bacterium]
MALLERLLDNRAKAFIVDVITFGFLWTLVDNTVIRPLPPWVLALGVSLAFATYFAIFEGMGRIRASPGKRIFKLRVIHHDGSRPSIQVAFLRALVLTPVLGTVAFDVLYEPLVSLLLAGTPWIFLAIAISLPAALLVWNAVFATRIDHGALIQDGLFATRVVAIEPLSDSEATTSETEPVSERPWSWTLFALVFVLSLPLGFTLAPGSKYMVREQRIQQEIGNQAQLRTYVRLGSEERPRPFDSRPGRDLVIRVRIPHLAWDDIDGENIAELAWKSAEANPNGYGGGVVELWSGFPGFFWGYFWQLVPFLQDPKPSQRYEFSNTS